MAAADYDHIYQQTESAAEFWGKVRDEGLKEAFTWRDSRYQDLRGSKS